MAHSRVYDIADPADTGDAGDGALEMRNFKEDFLERFALDHYIATDPSSIVDTSLPNADGYHKQINMKASTSDPVPMNGAGVLFTKTVSGVVDLYYANAAGTFLVVDREAYYYSNSKSTDGYLTWNTALVDTIGSSLSTTEITVPAGSYIIEMLPPPGYGVTSVFSFYNTGTSATTAFSGLLYTFTAAASTTFKIYVDLSGAVIASMRIKRL